MKYILLLLVLGTVVFAQRYQADRVTEMIVPGYNHPWYSGYLNISLEKAFHYQLFESLHDPDNDPVLLWLNGGPGCSSLIGFSYQNGPFRFRTNSTTMQISNFSWNRQANLLYIQSPGSVGFSLGPVASSDQSVATDNLQALITFFAMFPVFRNNPFYISGQSYAGIYVPFLAKAIHDHNHHVQTHIKINLKGFIVGNACTHPSECYLAGSAGTSLHQYQFLYKHAFYTDEQYNELKSACSWDFQSDACKARRSQLDKSFADTNSSILNIYSPCYYQDLMGNKKNHRLSLRSKHLPRGQLSCDDLKGAFEFFNNENIRIRLHLQRFPFNETWYPCNDEVESHYTMDENATYHLYPQLMKAGYRIWVYSGDVDADVPITGTLKWLHELRQQYHVKVNRPWREWWVHGRHPHQDQVGGMTWQLQNLTFVSIRGAGHMVPRDKHIASGTLIDHFLSGTTLPQKSF